MILGDGYTAAERGKFEKDARRATEILFSRSPFKEHRKDFNVWGLCPPAAQSGISRPSTGVYRDSPLGTSYDTFGSERYIMTTNNRALRDVASYAPYELIEILVNAETYGGGGIFNLYATVAIDSQWAPYVFVHEFGHHIAGLADEYYTSDVAYEPKSQRIEPWEPNVTALLDPAMLKWKDLVAPGTPVPTPWRKSEFEAYEHEIQAERRKIRAENRPESEMNALFEKEKNTRMNCSGRTSIRIALARSKARTTRRADTTGRRKTASCSPDTRGFVRYAGAPSNGSLACMQQSKCPTPLSARRAKVHRL